MLYAGPHLYPGFTPDFTSRENILKRNSPAQSAALAAFSSGELDTCTMWARDKCLILFFFEPFPVASTALHR